MSQDDYLEWLMLLTTAYNVLRLVLDCVVSYRKVINIGTLVYLSITDSTHCRKIYGLRKNFELQMRAVFLPELCNCFITQKACVKHTIRL
jgi:2-polyprenyl-3-methyl-5-hydroxy-6-metoxy-1,4-benzoquinol methylase